MVVEKISNTFYCHSPVNPPSPGLSVKITLNLKNANKIKLLDWKDGSVASFTLEVSEPGSIGLADSQNSTVERFIDDLILTCNLLLKKAAFSRQSYDSSYTSIERKPSVLTPAKVEKEPGLVKVVMVETVSLTTEVRITSIFEDELDENEILDLFGMIQKIRSGNIKTSLKLTDLQKSLHEYEAAMSSFESLGIFKHLFSSLELATNCDGKDRAGTNLDSYVNTITGIDVAKIEDWRKFNARTKHIDKNQNDEREYQEGLAKIGGKIGDLRRSVQDWIFHRLKNI